MSRPDSEYARLVMFALQTYDAGLASRLTEQGVADIIAECRRKLVRGFKPRELVDAAVARALDLAAESQPESVRNG
jgi:hypothetical protein